VAKVPEEDVVRWSKPDALRWPVAPANAPVPPLTVPARLNEIVVALTNLPVPE
jgi:hypothetical protein